MRKFEVLKRQKNKGMRNEDTRIEGTKPEVHKPEGKNIQPDNSPEKPMWRRSTGATGAQTTLAFSSHHHTLIHLEIW